MKSILSILPIVGFVAAKQQCSQETFTETVTNKITVTVPAPSASEASTTAAGLGSTTVIQKTIYVTPSPVPTFHPYPNGTFNGTFNHTVQAPTTFSTVSLPLVSSSAIEAEVSSAAAVSSSEAAAIPASESPVSSSSSYVASATSSSVASAPVATEAAGGNSGEATFYGGNVSGGMCSFTGYTIPSGIYGTALSDSNWDNAGNCGACVSVTGPSGNSIKALIVDQCPGCGTNHLDLFPDAFAALADPSKGIIDVTWSIVDCGITSPITLKNKEGTSAYWFAMQVVNSNVAVSKLEVSTNGGSTWQSTTRSEYNYFENASGFGTDTVDVKITSTNGKVITVKGVSVAASSTKTASSNF
ncbi:carbohydrate-binding module family 63 protein [Lophiostoma macrostomum CBS 122681]|uniref:Carbohydrate-binding module family 63 protein n=1 Tax=Lophiostoma macrostomum CBS 122681 TaxID=1314788 RepID=A0A6A6T2X3_9PLEO|nr:carbohydrate-binding module family 63 protein [Lophiostoma macrostomum CBS 122681]